jgi:transcription antitermination factor NusG
MDLLKNWLMQYDHDSIHSEALNASDKVRIRSGALMNKEAEVLESKGNYALLLLEDLGLQVKVDLRKNIIEKLQVS